MGPDRVSICFGKHKAATLLISRIASVIRS
jgi:hypothetical protein